ncbi:MAG: 3-phosphoshikimate 1-carboxyvinyltransferase [Tannerella sp.]|jgi:3-phosphoshikimate 1-carboxyvinyltransferase|nr:3-phosphoshikimate 1-carboxyvinyltransferase [Tannerella sp.]
MDYLITAPDRFHAEVDLPSSKSVSNRALIINELCPERTLLKYLAKCDDTDVLLHVLSKPEYTVNIDAAGTAMRFLTAFFAQSDEVHILTGSERMKQRPLGALLDALRTLGAHIVCLEKEGFAPLHIFGRELSGGEITIDSSVSSQFISALLMIAPRMTQGLRLYLKGTIISRPYIDLTINMMRRFGVDVMQEGNMFYIPNQEYRNSDVLTIEADWSAASYWYEMVALSKDPDAEVSFRRLTENSPQGDAVVAKIFEQFGVKTVFNDGSDTTIFKYPCRVPEFFEYDFLPCPDIAQTLAVTCAVKGVPFRLTGLQSLVIKETNRLEALQNELYKLGVKLHIVEDSILEWDGKYLCVPVNPCISTYNDHRMAMAFAPAAMGFENILIINEDVVTKSYPDFWCHLQTAGFTLMPQNIA